MNRRDELQARLGPWAMVEPTLDYESCPDEVWEKYLAQAGWLAANNQKWFKIGIARAVNELKAKTAEGKPRWASREDLIRRLQSIHAPN